MLSVIIPAYNAEAYIDNCLRSVLLQQNAEFEVILVNDGSTDRTDELCREWCKHYKNIIYISQKNEGQGSARNRAITHAQGQWLVFLDADDELCPGALEELEQVVSDELDIICYEFLLRRRLSMVDERIGLSEIIIDKENLVGEATSFLWDKMFRTEFWRQNAIGLENVYGEDLKAVYLLLAKCRLFDLLRKPLVRHYERDDNLSSDPRRVMKITESTEKTICEFIDASLFETYHMSLFRMVYRQYYLYQDPRFCSFEQKQLQKIQQELKRILDKYFKEFNDCLKLVQKTELVLIGKNCFWGYKDAMFFDETMAYDELEQFVSTSETSDIVNQFYLIDLSYEGRNYLFGTRSFAWQQNRWKALVEEFLIKASERGNIRGIVICGGINTFTQGLAKLFQERLSAEIVEEGTSVFEMAAKYMLNQQMICPSRPDLKDSFWCRGEQYRLQYNENILNAWLKLKYQGKSFEPFFQSFGYKKIAIYGMGYLGERLFEELNQTEIEVVCGIEKTRKETDKLEVYSLQEEWPQVDAIIVSVVHLFSSIKYDLEQKTSIPILSLESIIEYLLGGKYDCFKSSGA